MTYTLAVDDSGLGDMHLTRSDMRDVQYKPGILCCTAPETYI